MARNRRFDRIMSGAGESDNLPGPIELPDDAPEPGVFPRQHDYRIRLRELLDDLDARRQVVEVGPYRITGIAIGGGWVSLANGEQCPFYSIYETGIMPKVDRMTARESARLPEEKNALGHPEA